MVIGREDSKFLVDIICSNQTVNDSVVASVEMNLKMDANTEIKAFVAFPNIGTVNVTEIKVVNDKVGITNHEVKQLLNVYFNEVAFMVNEWYNQDGYPLANINPTIGLLAGVLQNFVVTPNKFNEFLMIGWSMYADF